jgi:hypothetical protein
MSWEPSCLNGNQTNELNIAHMYKGESIMWMGILACPVKEVSGT